MSMLYITGLNWPSCGHQNTVAAKTPYSVSWQPAYCLCQLRIELFLCTLTAGCFHYLVRMFWQVELWHKLWSCWHYMGFVFSVLFPQRMLLCFLLRKTKRQQKEGLLAWALPSDKYWVYALLVQDKTGPEHCCETYWLEVETGKKERKMP